jgi:serine/threonine protein kinase/WD40 repeat protein
MSDSSSAPDPNDVFFGQFLKELTEAPDKEAVVRKYTEQRPELAADLRKLAALNGLLERTGTDAPADPEQPRQLGEFRILRRIGRGGMGEIYEAEHERLRRRVAVKVLRQGKISPTARDRFLREQKVLARLHQTHIVPIHTAGEEGSLQFFVMPYIRGAGLHHVVEAARQMESTQPRTRTPPLGRLAGLVGDNRDASTGPTAKGPAGEEASTTPCPSPASPPGGRLVLSLEYFRSVAELMADAAEAVAYAHGAGILHRDLKPSNILVDRAGQCWLIDFGLAGFVGGPGATLRGDDGDLDADALTATGFMGTPNYMAPEQFQGVADVRTDVWGLGATLYELLTLRRAFEGSSVREISRKIVQEEPATPPGPVSNPPRDLAAIAGKAMRKEPAQRYARAQEFAEDLRRWLRLEPTTARPAWPARRVALWARRNKGWAAAIAVALVTAAALVALAFVWVERQAELTRQRLADAEARAQADRRAVLVQQLLVNRTTERRHNWSGDSWKLIQEAAPIRPEDNGDLRDEATAALVGLDADLVRRTDDGAASSIALDPKTGLVLLGGAGPMNGQPAQPARVINYRTGQMLHRSGRTDPGPVAFREDVPLQFVADAQDPCQLLLWDVARQQAVREFRLPVPRGGVREQAAVVLSMTADGAYVAATPLDDEAADVRSPGALWDARTGKILRPITVPASALAIRPDGRQLATGHKDGSIRVWDVASGRLVQQLESGGNRVHCLVFHRDYWRRGQTRELERGWLLAAGYAGANVVVWDLSREHWPRSVCRGATTYNVYALAFSPDGTTLVSAGHDWFANVWDTATGRLLLKLHSREWVTGIAYSADGSHLITSSRTAFAQVTGLDVWAFQNGRGIRTLRGLSGPVSKLSFSPDRRYLAALSRDWQLGIWDLQADRLLYVLDPPRGKLADNAALAFSRDGRRFAYSSGEAARLWDVASGDERERWQLPPGMTDALVFHPDGPLLLFRVESPDKKHYPRPDGQDVCRLRALRDKGIADTIAEKVDFQDVAHLEVALGGRAFVGQGKATRAGRPVHLIKLFDGLTGGVGGEYEAPLKTLGFGISLDSEGRFLAFNIDLTPAGNPFQIVELPSGKPVCILEDNGSLAPGLAYRARNDSAPPFGVLLFARSQADRVARLGVGTPTSSVDLPFSADGKLLAWGNSDGSVYVCDLEAVRQRLNRVGLGWD